MIAIKGQLKPIVLALSAIVFVLCFSAHAQQSEKVARIGFLTATSPSVELARIKTFRQGLHDLGYVEGKNIVIEWRFAEGRLDRLPALAAELVRLKVDVIVTTGPVSTRPAKEATATIPIVMAFDNDPVGSGLVASLARPGGNITGLSALAPELTGKRLELLKETVPKLSRLAILGTSTELGYAQTSREIKLDAEALKVQLQYLDVQNPKDTEAAFQDARKNRADAVLVLPSSVFISQRTQLAELAVKNRLPSMYYRREFVEDGGLMSYGVSFPDMSRRAATYVDKILKGAKPGDLPVEQPTKFELVINLKTANQIDVAIPQKVLARADRVIK